MLILLQGGLHGMDKVDFPRVLAPIFCYLLFLCFFLVVHQWTIPTTVQPLVEFVVPVPLIGYFVNHSELFYGILSCVFTLATKVAVQSLILIVFALQDPSNGCLKLNSSTFQIRNHLFVFVHPVNIQEFGLGGESKCKEPAIQLLWIDEVQMFIVPFDAAMGM